VLPVGEDIGTGGNRLQPFAVTVDARRMQHRQRTARVDHLLQEERVGPVQFEHDGLGIGSRYRHDFHAAGTVENAAALEARTAFHQEPETPFDLGGGHRRAVMKQHAMP
jgi:hypothetical protein